MNQSNLYAALDKAGCKILSFEDFPTQQGSWRASFMKAGNVCEISSNRYDGYISLRSKLKNNGSRKSVINSLKLMTDEAELFAVNSWLRSIPSASSVTSMEKNSAYSI